MDAHGATPPKDQPQDNPPPPQAEPEVDEGASSSGSEIESNEAEEEAVDFHFPDDAAADAVREEAVKLYNAGAYNDALDRQYRVVRYYAEKYGATSAKASKYFLDYALSQLRVLQSQSTLEDVLQPRDEEAMETCFINLEMARVGLQKKEDEIENSVKDPLYVETELMLAEVHNALAQLCVEKEDFDSALKEYEAELLIYRSLQEEQSSGAEPGTTDIVPAGRVVAVLYGIADCFIKEGDFSGAEERLQATLDEVHKYPAGTIGQDLVDELNDLLEDAKEMKDGKFQQIQEEIDRQFVAQQAEKVPTAQEFYDGTSAPTVMGANGEEKANPYVSSVPGGGAKHHEGSHLSMPLSAHGTVLGFGTANANNENSNSVSFFPPQQLSRSGPPGSGSTAALGSKENSTVNTVVARKKAKVPMGSPSASNSVPPVEPESKRLRTE